MFLWIPWIHQDVCQRAGSFYSALYVKLSRAPKYNVIPPGNMCQCDGMSHQMQDGSDGLPHGLCVLEIESDCSHGIHYRLVICFVIYGGHLNTGGAHQLAST